MAKIVSTSAQIGDAGIAIIHRLVNDMGYVWRVPGGADAGIDGHIELRDPTTGSMLNQLICVQSKATDADWAAETDDAFSFSCKPTDIEYWMQGNVPVILVCSRPRTNEAYWISVKEFFADAQRRASCKAVFDKKRNRFDQSAAAALLQLALASEPGIHVVPQRVEETLWANLLPVRYPTHLWLARSSFRNAADVHAELKARRAGHLTEWLLTGPNLLSIHPLDERPWDGICGDGTVESFSTDDWAMADDERQWEFATLLARMLHQKVRADLEWSRICECYYFRAEGDVGNPRPRTLTYESLQKQASRDVVTPIAFKQDATRVYAWRHSAFAYQFIRLGSQWLLALEPTYYFTKPETGHLHPASHKMISALRRLEKNPSVLGQAQMWASYLGRGNTIFQDAYPHLLVMPLVQARCDRGFSEEGWYDLDGEEVEADDDQAQRGSQQEIQS